MSRRKVSFLRKGSKGLTLVELILALAIGSMVIAGASATMRQLFLTGASNENYMIAVRQVQDAGNWISRDAIMAQEITPDDGATGFPLTISWAEWGTGLVTTISYTLTGDSLSRQQITNGTTTQFVVARYITSAEAEFPTVEGAVVEDVLKVTVTAEVGTATETRIYKVKPRSAD